MKSKIYTQRSFSFSSICRIRDCPPQGEEELKVTVFSTDKRAHRQCYLRRTGFFFFSLLHSWLCLCKFWFLFRESEQLSPMSSLKQQCWGAVTFVFYCSVGNPYWLQLTASQVAAGEGTNIKQYAGTVSLAQTFLGHSKLEQILVTLRFSSKNSFRQLYKRVQSSVTAQNLLILNSCFCQIFLCWMNSLCIT